MKYIELLGLPGSGKSTLANEIVTLLRAKRRTVLTRWDAKDVVMRKMIRKQSGLSWRFLALGAYFVAYPILHLLWGRYRYLFALRFIGNYPQLVQQVIEAAVNVELPELHHEQAHKVVSSEQLLTWFFDVACVYQAAQEFLATDDVLLIEEGLCQQAFYLLCEFRKPGVDDQKLKRYLQLIPKPDALIALFVDPQECEERMRTRTKGIANMLRTLPVGERIALLEQRQETYRKIADDFETQKIEVIRLDETNHTTVPKYLAEKLIHF
jgi:thymidylate kinase